LTAVLLLILWTAEISPGGHATILLYHRFGDDRYPSTSVSLEDFYRQMKYLKDNGYRVLPLSKLVDLIEKGGEVPPKTVVITIDDGYRSTMKAFEILRDFGYPFTLFLYMEAVGRYPDFLSLEDLEKLKEYGKVEFENHSYSHRAFGFDVDLKRFLEDLERSEERFVKLFGRKPEMYAFPYGFYNLALIEVLRQRGYRAVFTQDPGNVDGSSDLFRLNRQAIVGSWSKMNHFVKKLRRENLPLKTLLPEPGFLETNPPPLIGGELRDPSGYGDCRVYVSEIGWRLAQRDKGMVYIKVKGPLKSRWNRIGVKCKNVKTGRWAETFWFIMRRKGHRCAGLVRKGKELDSIRVEGIWGEFSQRVVTVTSTEVLDFLPDVIILSVKSFDTEEALKRVYPIVGDQTYLLIAQNGYGNYEKAVKIYGEGRVILSRIIYGSEVVERGRIRITVCADEVVIGDPSGKIEEDFLINLAKTFSEAGIPTRYDPRVYEYLWAKIIYNSALNPLGAILGVNYGYLADDPSTRFIMDRIIDEIFEVLKAKGIKTFWDSADQYKNAFYNELIPPTRDHYPSMLHDLRRGRTEIDSLNGAVCVLGKEAGVPTPYNRAITELVKAMESLAKNR